MDGFKVDYKAMMQQLKDHVAIELLATMSPDEKSAKLIVDSMGVFVRNGVPVETALKIFKELTPIFNNFNEEKESDQ